eukprot:gene39038-7883_t
MWLGAGNRFCDGLADGGGPSAYLSWPPLFPDGYEPPVDGQRAVSDVRRWAAPSGAAVWSGADVDTRGRRS